MIFRRAGRRRPSRTRAVPAGAAFVIPGMVLAMALAGCAGRSSPGQATGAPASPVRHQATTTATPQLHPRGTGPTVSPQVAAIVKSMTLAQKVGQLLVPAVPGLTAARD
jgi:hypothetical protein